MEILPWSEEFSVGIKSIDSQHKKWISLLNVFYHSYLEGRTNDVLTTALDELVMYTRTHLKSEEKLMQEYRYPDYNAHKKEHNDLTKKIADLEHDYNFGKIQVGMNMMETLKSWLMNHILKNDKVYESYFKEKGVS